MTPANITRTDAALRAKTISNVEYRIELDLVDHDSLTFGNQTTVSFDATPGATSWIDLIAPEVIQINLNGQDLALSNFNGFRIELPKLEAKNKLVIISNCAYSSTGEGLHRFIDPVDNHRYLYSQFETADARRAFPCFDQPDVKATYVFEIKAPTNWIVASNTLPTPATKLSEDIALWQFPKTEIMSTYITGIIGGPYHVESSEYKGNYGAYPLRVLCRQSLKEYVNAEFMFKTVIHGFKVFERDFKVGYPFGKYDQIFVPEFNSGAMENAGCVTFRDEYIWRGKVTAYEHHWLSNVVLHELAHMWFGNYVTMEWWNDLWLNESFAEWAAYHAQQEQPGFEDAWVNFLTTRKSWGYRQTQLPSSHPIATEVADLESVWDNFDGISYAMGASVLRQLTVAVGIETFLKGLEIYFNKHAWSNARFEDLLAAIGQAANRDLSDWAQDWIRQAGVTLLRPNIEIKDGVFEFVQIAQDPPSSPDHLDPVLRDHKFALGHYELVDGELSRTRQDLVEVKGASTDISVLKGLKVPTMLLLNDDDLTFAKIRLDDQSWSNVVEHFASLKSALARGLIWDAAWDATRDAETSVTDYIKLALNGIASEPDPSTIAITVRNLKTAADQYASPTKQAMHRKTIASKMLEQVIKAAPGSDHQLAFVRGLAAFAVKDAGLTEIANWYENKDIPAGLAVDTDLRWTLLSRLVRTGVAGLAEIEKELEIDNSSKGIEESVRLKAAIPTKEAKQKAWDSVVNQSDATNAIVEATNLGFNDFENSSLSEEFIDPYFEMLPKLWSSDRGYHVSQGITISLFPMPALGTKLVTVTEKFLTQPNLETSTKRFVSERLADVQRAMAARAKDN
jgi:aminopeptidase N